MFIDQEWKKEQQKIGGNTDQYDKPRPDVSRQLFYYFILAIIIVANVAIFGLVWYFKMHKAAIKDNNPAGAITETATNTIGKLPGDIGDISADQGNYGSSTANLKIEEITFGLFYRKNQENIARGFTDYNLPLNIKTDVSNYYDVSRKINLDNNINELNKGGFAFVKADLSKGSDNFYGAYHYLANKRVPLLITSDFMFYYFQNTLKQVYKEIEKNAFYYNVWDISKKSYDIALTRYKKRLVQVGQVNDPVLEAERMETAYFAVALKLLMPKPEQVNSAANFIDGNKFTTQDLENYYFDIPAELKDDIEKEYKQITGASGKIKSPVLMYKKDYADFKVPDNYKSNAKLNNFYLALKWLNSVFPLYPISESCPDCLLDENDWIINFGAANLISQDIYDNQEIKNEWAIVYKFEAFFNGLRKDLTYLQYYDALSEKFGEQAVIENIFNSQNRNRASELKELQAKIAAVRYPLLEGGMDRNDQKMKPQLGMRLLQESYWPNDHIYKLISGEDMILTVKTDKSANLFAGCFTSDKRNYYRCRGFGLDIINLLAPKAIIANDDYYKFNTAYTNYDQRISQIGGDIAKFNTNSWNDNVYWLTLDLDRLLMTYDTANMPRFASTDAWRRIRDVNIAEGAWANVHMDEDQLINYYEQETSNLGSYTSCDMSSYIEPNIEFISDLIARNAMLIQILNRLNVAAKTNTANGLLKDMEATLQGLLDIAKKERIGEALTDDDCKTINDFARHYILDGKSKKQYTISSTNKAFNLDLSGIKLLALVYNRNNQNILVVGPVYNYNEY